MKNLGSSGWSLITGTFDSLLHEIIYSALGGSAATFRPIVGGAVGGLCVHGGTDCCRAPHSFTKKRVYVLRYLSFFHYDK